MSILLLSGSSNALPGLIIGGLLSVLGFVGVVLLIALVVFIIYFLKSKDDFVIEDISTKEIPEPIEVVPPTKKEKKLAKKKAKKDAKKVKKDAKKAEKANKKAEKIEKKAKNNE